MTLSRSEYDKPLYENLFCLSRQKRFFTGADGDYKYVIGSKSADLRAMSGEINAAIYGKGGGSSAMIQGTSRASRDQIEKYFGI